MRRNYRRGAGWRAGLYCTEFDGAVVGARYYSDGENQGHRITGGPGFVLKRCLHLFEASIFENNMPGALARSSLHDSPLFFRSEIGKNANRHSGIGGQHDAPVRGSCHMPDGLGQCRMNGLQRGIRHGAFLRRQRVEGEIIGVGERVMIAGSRGWLIEQF